MTRYIYIDDNYKNVFLRSSSAEQRATMKSVAMFMSASDTKNEERVEKKLILKGVTKKEVKAFMQGTEEDKEDMEYENWMNYIKMACSQGDTTLVKFDEEENREDIKFFENIVNDEDVDMSGLKNTYWLSHCLCGKSLNECKPLENKYGISFIGIDQDVTQHEPDATFLVQEERYDWNEMINGRNSHTMFILDQYAFNPEHMMLANIITIMKNIICTKSDLQISAYTCNNNMNLNDIENKIKEELVAFNPSVSVNILSTGGTFHDRVLITNNLYITIGGGFDALNDDINSDNKQSSRKYTTLHVYSNPAISTKEWLRNEYFGYINAISKQYNKFQQKVIRTRNPILYPNRLVRPIGEI